MGCTSTRPKEDNKKDTFSVCSKCSKPHQDNTTYDCDHVICDECLSDSDVQSKYESPKCIDEVKYIADPKEEEAKDGPIEEKTLQDYKAADVEEENKDASDDETEMCYLDNVISIKQKNDSNIPSVQDFHVMVVDGLQCILVADDSNDCLKLFQKKKDKFEYSCAFSLSSSPFQLAMIDSVTYAVTLPLERQIVVVSVGKTLTLKSKITTDKEYFGLALLNDSNMACGAPLELSPTIDVIDHDGKVLYSYCTSDSYGGQFVDMSFMTNNSARDLIVVDPKDHALVCLSVAGDVIWRYASDWKDKLVSPAGVVCDSSDKVYVADSSRRVILQMSHDGHKLSELEFKGPLSSMPHALSFCEGKLYVCTKYGHLSAVPD